MVHVIFQKLSSLYTKNQQRKNGILKYNFKAPQIQFGMPRTKIDFEKPHDNKGVTVRNFN